MNKILNSADKIIEMNRKKYGDSKKNLEVIAERWSSIFKQKVTPMQVLLAMIDLKISRIVHDEKYADSIIDIAGYAGLASDFLVDEELPQ